MTKTEWHYSYDKKKWWMITVTTNSDEMPKLLPPSSTDKNVPVRIKGIDLYGENKKLWTAILAITGCLGVSLAMVAWLLVS